MTAPTGSKIPKGYEQGQIQQFTPEMMELWKSLFSQVGPDSYLAKLAGGDQSMFEQMEAPAMRQFQELTGQTASRFSGAGMGARRGSGFQNTMGQQTADFASQLQSKRQEMQMNAIKELMGLSQGLLSQNPYENFLIEKQQKEPKQALGGWGGVIGAGLGGVGGFLAGGPGGAMTGAKLGYNVGQGF